MITVTKEFTFEAAHSLPHLPPEHKCSRLHGHSYRIVLHCTGTLVADHAWVVDYADIAAAWLPLHNRLDHHNLNDVMQCITTAENLALWIANELRPSLPLLSCVEVHETPTSNVIFHLPRVGHPFANCQ